MSKIVPYLSLVAAISLGLGASPRPAHAATMVATGGHSMNFADSACWTQWGGTITNGCDDTRWWELDVTATGNGPVSVTVLAHPGTTVECFEFTTTHWATAYRFSSLLRPSIPGIPQTLTFSEQVPSTNGVGGTAIVYCAVDPGAKVLSMNW